jgi:hypothetical protein
VVAINRSVRGDDEWFDEPYDLDGVEGALAAIDLIEDPVEGALLAFRVAWAQAFGEGQQTDLHFYWLLGSWIATDWTERLCCPRTPLLPSCW